MGSKSNVLYLLNMSVKRLMPDKRMARKMGTWRAARDVRWARSWLLSYTMCSMMLSTRPAMVLEIREGQRTESEITQPKSQNYLKVHAHVLDEVHDQTKKANLLL